MLMKIKRKMNNMAEKRMTSKKVLNSNYKIIINLAIDIK